MKEILIRAKINEETGKIATIIKTNGYKDSMSSTLEIVGVLENIKMQQYENLKSIGRKFNL